jgi:hypothetical protein
MKTHNSRIKFYKIVVCLAFAGVILNPSLTFNGALSGLKLWAEVVLPGLFPALIVTSCILCLFPMQAGISYFYILITGLLCGFPVGAYLCSQFHTGRDEKVCEKLMAFCNMSSPSFVANFIIMTALKDVCPVPVVLLCIYLPVFETVFVLLFFCRREIFSKNNYAQKIKFDGAVKMIDDAIWNAILSMLKLGGYIVVFSCICTYICVIPFNNPYLTAVICAITEITNGIYLLGKLSVPPLLKITAVCAANAFGGLSTVMQTAGITKSSGLSMKKYICFKLLLVILTILNCLVICQFCL